MVSIELPSEPGTRVPDAKYPFRHYLPVQTRFNDFDMLGHINNSVYYTFFDMGKSHYFEAVNQGPIDWHNVGVVIANTNCDFYKPIFFDDSIAVVTTVIALGKKSFQIEQRIINAKNHLTHARCVSVMAAYNPETLKSAEVPESWVENLGNFEGRAFEDVHH